MALKIRLRQQGRTNRQTYRLVVADRRSPRDGKYIEMLGWYNPCEKENNVSVNVERVQHWLAQGALISDQARNIVAKMAPEVEKGIVTIEMVKREKRRDQRKKSSKKA